MLCYSQLIFNQMETKDCDCMKDSGNKIKEHLSEGRRYEHLKEIQLKEYLSLYANLTNKEENEHSNLRHIFNDRRATKQ